MLALSLILLAPLCLPEAGTPLSLKTAVEVTRHGAKVSYPADRSYLMVDACADSHCRLRLLPNGAKPSEPGVAVSWTPAQLADRADLPGCEPKGALPPAGRQQCRGGSRPPAIAARRSRAALTQVGGTGSQTSHQAHPSSRV